MSKRIGFRDIDVLWKFIDYKIEFSYILFQNFL